MATSRRALAVAAAAVLLTSACSDDPQSTTDLSTKAPTSTDAASAPTPTDTDLSTSTFGDTDQSTSTLGDSDLSTSTFGDSDLSTSTFGDTDQSTSTAAPEDGDTSTATAAPTEAPADEQLPAFSQDAVEGSEQGDGQLLSTTVRLGVHDDYDRVVFDLEGTGTPGYRVDYVDQAVQDGSGQIIDVAGDAILQVVISGTRYPEEGESYEGGPGTYSLDAAEVVEEVRLSGTFEGLTQGFIGIDDEGSPFRVFTLSDPPRLVVDIQHP